MSQFLQWGIVLITIPNLVVIGLMVAVFAVGAIIALPHNPEQE